MSGLFDSEKILNLEWGSTHLTKYLFKSTPFEVICAVDLLDSDIAGGPGRFFFFFVYFI